MRSGGDIARRSVVADGKRISYLATEGERSRSDQAILLIPESGVSARSWTAQLEGFGQALQILAIDFPGHGHSAKS